jgi:NADH-quinone oxidoreductase subunit C
LSSGPEAPVEEAPVEEVEVDERRQAMLEALGDLPVDSHIGGGDITVRVAADRWRDAVKACRERLDMDYFCFLSGIDWLNNPSLSGEKVWGALPEEEGDEDDAQPEIVGVETGVAGGDTRFQVLCRLYSTTKKIGITLKADLDEAAPAVASIEDIFRGADWHEREAWEMYGFDFPGHPGLRHVYLPGGFEGHPLRKDFPLLAREVKPWPGLVDVEPLPGGGEEGEGEEGAAE